MAEEGETHVGGQVSGTFIFRTNHSMFFPKRGYHWCGININVHSNVQRLWCTAKLLFVILFVTVLRRIHTGVGILSLTATRCSSCTGIRTDVVVGPSPKGTAVVASNVAAPRVVAIALSERCQNELAKRLPSFKHEHMRLYTV